MWHFFIAPLLPFAKSTHCQHSQLRNLLTRINSLEDLPYFQTLALFLFGTQIILGLSAYIGYWLILAKPVVQRECIAMGCFLELWTILPFFQNKFSHFLMHIFLRETGHFYNQDSPLQLSSQSFSSFSSWWSHQNRTIFPLRMSPLLVYAFMYTHQGHSWQIGKEMSDLLFFFFSCISRDKWLWKCLWSKESIWKYSRELYVSISQSSTFVPEGRGLGRANNNMFCQIIVVHLLQKRHFLIPFDFTDYGML